MLCAVTEVQEVWRDTASPSWKLLRGWARLALWGRTWRWWFREFIPSQCLTALPWPSLNPEFPPGLPQLLLLQKRAKPGTIRQAYNEPPSATFGLSLDVKIQWIIFQLLWMFLSHNMNYSFLGKKQNMHAGLLGLRPCMLLLGGTVWVSVVELLFTAQQAPTKCSRCLQPYGIVWQRTQTFLIESSRSVSDSGQFSGKTTLCFQYFVHQQARVESMPTCSPLGGTGLQQPLLP